MSVKADKRRRAKPTVRYTAEDLAVRDPAADETALDVFLDRNKGPLNASIEKAHAEFKRGKYYTLDQVAADIGAQRQRRKREA